MAPAMSGQRPLEIEVEVATATPLVGSEGAATEALVPADRYMALMSSSPDDMME